ncbi:MAG: M42 family metallopeptidase [Candidatus Cloacimonadaceae bacterium]|jgi:endoglucanase|nr:M42 family metallopeptidase [Candidatus Cloacimonadota bacterium]MCK9243165.1 M42 family metallopeptidase [Candidatus Cloacimonadota bacterium]MDD3102653.1 M42 family metallopeptidase [Candidatus Cloacimonadota bacterium]MDY0128022.1 M42 family metallopeptidase [Candidatus Cloacimonadaceae bacterium]
MNKTNKEYLYKLLKVASPSGFETQAQEITRNYLKGSCDDISSDINGNLIAFKRGSGEIKVMLVGHADEVGFMINHIDDNGYLYVKSLGGFDVNLLPGLRLDIHHEGKVVRGIIGKNPPHMSRGDTDTPKLKMEDIWIDIGAKDKDDALKKVSIGDPITFRSEIEELSDDIIVSKATDNKVGVYVAAAVMKALAKTPLVANYYAVASVGEETTMKGAQTSSYKIEPDIAIAVDVTFSSDTPGVDKRKFGDVSLGKGPVLALGAAVHPRLNQDLQDLAKKHKIPLQLEIAPGRTGTDADAIHAQRSGVATVVLSIPNRYMHSPNEIINLNDLENAVKLLTEFVKTIDDKTDLSR